MVTITTLVWGISALILLVASRPSITGILTSMRTRSGRRSRQDARASWPSLASAMTLIPSSPESMVLRPSLTRAWSSAIRRRAGPVCVASSIPPASSKCTVFPSASEKHPDPAKYRRSPMSRLFPRYEPIAPCLFRDERKYTRAKSFVAIGMRGAAATDMGLRATQVLRLYAALFGLSTMLVLVGVAQEPTSTLLS